MTRAESCNRSARRGYPSLSHWRTASAGVAQASEAAAGQHPADRRLLEHELADKYRPGADSGLAPRQVPAVGSEPGDDGPFELKSHDGTDPAMAAGAGTVQRTRASPFKPPACDDTR